MGTNICILSLCPNQAKIYPNLFKNTLKSKIIFQWIVVESEKSILSTSVNQLIDAKIFEKRDTRFNWLMEFSFLRINFIIFNTCLGMSLQFSLGTWLHTCLGTCSQTSLGTCWHSSLGTWLHSWRGTCLGTFLNKVFIYLSIFSPETNLPETDFNALACLTFQENNKNIFLEINNP